MPTSTLTTALSQLKLDCVLALVSQYDLVRHESWTLKKLQSQRTAEVFTAYLWDKLNRFRLNVDGIGGMVCGQTSPTLYVLLRKLSMVSNTHLKEINGRMRNVSKQLQWNTPPSKSSCSLQQSKPLPEIIGRREGKGNVFLNGKKVQERR